MPHFRGIGRRLQASVYLMLALWPTANILGIQGFVAHEIHLPCGCAGDLWATERGSRFNENRHIQAVILD